MSLSNKEIKSKILEHEETIQTLLKRIDQLEGKVTLLESKNAITSFVNTHLAEELDNLRQYSHRSCLIMEGVSPSAPEVEEKVKNILQGHILWIW